MAPAERQTCEQQISPHEKSNKHRGDSAEHPQKGTLRQQFEPQLSIRIPCSNIIAAVNH
jgi:hypothetical protein